MEIRDLYDIHKRVTGKTFRKGEPIPDDGYMLIVLSVIQNSKGEFLIQKRSSVTKDGKYSSTGGHPKAGESSVDGMISELKEELGLRVSPDDLKLILSKRVDLERVFFDVYYMKSDLDVSSLSLQAEEVESVEWMSLNKIHNLIDKDMFLGSLSDEVFGIVEKLN